jgi:hypothetical protein
MPRCPQRLFQQGHVHCETRYLRQRERGATKWLFYTTSRQHVLNTTNPAFTSGIYAQDLQTTCCSEWGCCAEGVSGRGADVDADGGAEGDVLFGEAGLMGRYRGTGKDGCFAGEWVRLRCGDRIAGIGN